jgi:hypothetical protein
MAPTATMVARIETMVASFREAASKEVGLPSFAFEFDLN